MSVRRQGRNDPAEVEARRLGLGHLEEPVRAPSLAVASRLASAIAPRLAAPLVALDGQRRRCRWCRRCRQRKDDVALLQAAHRQRRRRCARHQRRGTDRALELGRRSAPRSSPSMTSEPMLQLAPAGGRSTKRTSLQLDAAGLQRIAPAEAGQRRAAAQQLAERPGKARGLPAADAELSPAVGLKVDQRHAAIEQADLDVADLGRAVALDLGLDPARRVALHERHGRDTPRPTSATTTAAAMTLFFTLRRPAAWRAGRRRRPDASCRCRRCAGSSDISSCRP